MEQQKVMVTTKKYKSHLLKQLQDPEESAEYLNACLRDDDPRVFLLALQDVVEATDPLKPRSVQRQKKNCISRCCHQKGRKAVGFFRRQLMSDDVHDNAPTDEGADKGYSGRRKLCYKANDPPKKKAED